MLLIFLAAQILLLNMHRCPIWWVRIG